MEEVSHSNDPSDKRGLPDGTETALHYYPDRNHSYPFSESRDRDHKKKKSKQDKNADQFITRIEKGLALFYDVLLVLQRFTVLKRQ
jgi:hypothetical protein